MKKKIACFIPVRSGSKRIKNKNIKIFCGKPIIAYSIQAAKKSKLFSRIIVSTDSKRISRIAKKYGAEVPFLRSKLLSNDYVTIYPVISNIVRFLIKQNYQFEYVCCVSAPNPFLEISDLKMGFKKIKSKKSKK